MRKWKAKNIQEAVHKIITDREFTRAAIRLKERMESIYGRKNSAHVSMDNDYGGAEVYVLEE